MLQVEESKFDELFSFEFKYTFDTLKLIMKQIIEKLNSQQAQIIYLRDQNDKMLKQAGTDKQFD